MANIKLDKGIAIVDEGDVDFISLWNWKNFNGYAFAGRMPMHRVIMDLPMGKEVDHINRNPLDNRRDNLRIVTHRQNHLNRRNKSKTGFIGVYEKNGKYEARIVYKGKKLYLGIFDDIIKAVEKYEESAKKFYGDNYKL